MTLSVKIPIFFDAGFAQAIHESKVRTLYMFGRPIESQGPDWFYKYLIDTRLGFFIVELVNADGRSANHYFDNNFSFYSNAIDQLPLGLNEIVKKHYISAINDRYYKQIERGGCASDGSENFLSSLNVNALLELYNLHQDCLRHNNHYDLLISDIDDKDGLGLPFIDHILNLNFYSQQLSAIQTGGLSIPSPADGRLLHVRFCLLFNSNEFYRFYAYAYRDESSDRMYYLICGDWNHRVLCLYIPSLQSCYFLAEKDLQFLKKSLHCKDVKDAFMRHIHIYGNEINDIIESQNNKCIIVISHWHIGHHLWNELSGLWGCIKNCELNNIPNIVIVDAPATEMYGKLHAIFPEIAGKTNRDLSDTNELIAYLYRNKIIPLRPTCHHISSDLRDRIIGNAHKQESTRQAKTDIGKFLQEGFKFVMLGIRAGNRTVVDPIPFYSHLIEKITEKLGKVVFVLDGINKMESTEASEGFRTLVENSAGSSPLDIELDIADKLLHKRDLSLDARVVSTVGQTIACSLVYAEACEFFVTPWGAGLAKYRWVNNLPGIYVSNSYFLGIDESYIYDIDENMEMPERSFRIQSADVDAVALENSSENDHPTRFNFNVRLDALDPQIDQIIQYLKGKS